MKPEIHLINPMTNIGGSELRTINLYRVLERVARVTIWTDREPHPELARMAPIRKTKLSLLRFPRQGVFVFVGAYFEVDRWWNLAKPARTILLYNILNRRRLHRMLERLRLGGKHAVEIVYASEILRRDAGLPGIVEHSPIDLQLFSPARSAVGTARQRRFVVGRSSRDELLKFSEVDPALYTRLADDDVDVRIVGGTCLASQLAPHPRISLLPNVPPRDVPSFIRGLDCFLYRTSANLVEAYGRVIAEAMACGVPAIVGSRVGIAQYIEHGVNGFVTDSNDETIDIITCLKSNENLKSRIGVAARDTIEGLHSGARLDAMTSYYLHGTVNSSSTAVTENEKGDNDGGMSLRFDNAPPRTASATLPPAPGAADDLQKPEH